MATYTRLAKLQGNTLQYGDYVVFDYEGFHVKYEVCFTELSGIDCELEPENEIFKLLGLNAYDFCEQHYTKLRSDWTLEKLRFPNYWPPYKWGEFKYITKVVLELFRLIEETKQLAETSTTLFID